MKISQYEILTHGIENSSYFQGCGVSHTPYRDVATGIGRSTREALEDAAAQLAASGWEIPDALEEEIEQASEFDQIADYFKHEHDEPENHELYVYVSIRVRGTEEA